MDEHNQPDAVRRKTTSMFSFLKKDPIRAFEQKRRKLLEEAMLVQRSGDLKLYAQKMEVIDALEKELDALHKGGKN